LPAPSNDTFAAAPAIEATSLPAFIAGTTFDATKEGSESTTIGTNVQSVWYTFTATSTGWYKFWIHDADSTYHGIFGFDDRQVQIRIFPDGVLTAMTLTNEITDAFDNSSNHNDVECTAFFTNGTKYYIRVAASGTSNQHTFDFTLNWDHCDQPANDDLANVVTLGSVPVAETGQTTYDAQFESGESFASTLGGTGMESEQSVWYKFTPSVTGKYKFGLENITWIGDRQIQAIVQISTQSTLAGYTTANELKRISISGFGSPAFGYDYVDLVASTDYYIRVSSAWGKKNSGASYNSSSIDFDLIIEATSPPANDDFADAEVLTTTLPGSLTATCLDATQEASEPDSGFPNAPDDQTIWYSFTPAVSGLYEFRVPHSSLVYDGITGNPNNGEMQMMLADITDPADFDSSHQVGSWSYISYFDPDDGVIVATLTSGHTYYLRIWLDGTPFNTDSMTFDLEWDIVPPSANDDFADATSITGSSGTEDFDTSVGNTREVDEPDSMYWNGGGDQSSQWFDWTCPATGDYVFRVETLDTTNDQVTYDLAVWTGSALNALTKIARMWIGSKWPLTAKVSPATAVGFHGVSGTHYKIQVSAWGNSVHTASRLTWRTNTIAGDTAATAGSLPDGRVDNYGHTDDDLPPDFDTLLSGHPSWWFTDGQAGRVRWFKQTYSVDSTITLNARCWDITPTPGFGWSMADIGLIAYKGASYPSLTVAQTQDSEDVAMMVSDFLDDAETGELNNVDGTQDIVIDMLAGETLWVALFGLYDADYAGSDSTDASQFDIDLHIPALAPVNDSPDGDWFGEHNYPYYLGRSEWGDWWNEAEAGKAVGTTVGATSDVGESPHGGFGPVRSVWYVLDIARAGDYRIWVESSQDCVLSLYAKAGGSTVGASIAEDDDSGTGNWPQITATLTTTDYWIAVDSKTEGPFTLKWERVATGTPPANDDWADAEDVTASLPTSFSGTTIDATAEPDEREDENLAFGPKDTVWYKWTSDRNGQINVYATCESQNDDAYVQVDVWRGTSLATLERVTTVPSSGYPGKGWFSFFDTPAQIQQKKLTATVVNGDDIYIRVQTESGGSEDFTVYLDAEVIVLHLTPGGSEVGPFTDFATIPLRLTPSGVVEEHGAIIEAATVRLTLTPIVTWETQGRETTDAATVYLDLSVLGGECFSRFHFTGEGEAETRWAVDSALTRWAADPETRWLAEVEIQPGCH
jgi:hypothetical protein